MASPVAQSTDPASAVRARLLVAAESCFDRYGIAKTTMDDVARAGGVSRATVYRYFPDREALVVASVVRRARLNIPSAHKHMAKFSTFAEKLVEGLVYNIRRGQHDQVVQLLVGGQPALAARILGGKEIAHELTYELWEPILAAAQEHGEMRPELDLRETSAWLARVTLMMVAQEASQRLETEALRRELRTFVLPAFAVSDGAR
jgi:AcrR family transcriptional regulator